MGEGHGQKKKGRGLKDMHRPCHKEHNECGHLEVRGLEVTPRVWHIGMGLVCKG